MALLYRASREIVEDTKPDIRLIEEDDEYRLAITFSEAEGDDDTVTEILLTEAEVKEAADLVFNK